MILTLRERVEKIQREVAAGIITDESRYDYPYMVSLYNTGRAIALSMQWKATKRINPICYQKHYPKFELDLQLDNCIVRFRVPQVISLQGSSYGETTDGDMYVGDVSGRTSYRKIRDRVELSTINGHRFMKANGRYMGYMFDGAMGVVEVFGNPDLEKLFVNGIFMNPEDCNTYNVDVDNYPIDDFTADLVEKAIFQSTTSIIASGKPDYIDNGTDLGGLAGNIASQLRGRR